MSRFLKYRKLFILIMVALAVITAATAFSVSYAKWTSSGTQISSDGKTGTWEELTNPIYKIQFTGQTEEEATDFGRNEYNGIYSTYFTVKLDEEDKYFNILGETTGFTDIINVYTDSNDGKTKHCIVAGENGYKYKTNGAGTYTIAINTETKTITFSYIHATRTSYIHVINFNDKSSVAFIKDTASANRYSTTFAIDVDKSFNIIQNGDPIDLEKTELDINDECVIETGASNGFAFKTSKGAGIYTVVIELTLNGDSKLISSKITFTYEKLTGTDNNAAFAEAVRNPGNMKAKLNSEFGIITSNMEIIPFDTTAHESNYFTLEADQMFAILINTIRINGDNYGVITLPVGGIEQGTGGKSHLYTVTQTGTYYVTYTDDYDSKKVSQNVVIKSIDRVDFSGPVEITSNGVKKSNATLVKSADGSYTTEFTINEIEITDKDGNKIDNKNFNVYLNDAVENLKIATDNEKYLEASTTKGYAFAFKDYGSYKVTVANGEISVTSSTEKTASVTVNGANKVRLNQTLQLVATAKNAEGKELPMTGKTVTWRVIGTAATIDANGVLTGKEEGTVTVTATVDGVTSAEFTVNVLGKETVKRVTITGAKTVDAGKTITLTAKVTGEDGTTLTDREVTWKSSDDNYAEVSKGTVTGKKPGIVTITATVEGISASVTITVLDAVSTVTIDGADTVEVGGTINLTATVKGASGDTLTDRTVNWTISKNGSNATIDQNGVLTGVKAGTVTVTATADGKSGTFTVTVKAVTEKDTLSSVKLDGATTVAEGEGNSVPLTVTAVGSNNTDLTADSTITWAVVEADAAKATIDANGVLTLTDAKAGDTVTVTVTAEYDGVTKTATHTVTVEAVTAEWKSYQADFAGMASTYGNKTATTAAVNDGKFTYAQGVYFEDKSNGLTLAGGNINTQVKGNAIQFELKGTGNKNAISFVVQNASSDKTAIIKLDRVDANGTTNVWSIDAPSSQQRYTVGYDIVDKVGTYVAKDISAATYYLYSVTASARIGDLVIWEYVDGSGETPVTPPVGTVSDSIDMTKDTDAKGHKLNLTSDEGYFTVTSTTNYAYEESNSVLGSNVLVAGGGSRDMTITAGSTVQKITITVRIGLADSGSFNKAADATVTYPDATTKTITSTSDDNFVYSLEIELEAGQSVTISSAKRLAFVGASAKVTLNPIE